MREYEYFLTLLVTAAITYLLTPAVRKLALRINAIPATRDRDVAHADPIPRLGGMAMYFGVAAGLIVATEFTSFRTVIQGSGLVNGLLLAGGLIVIIGIIDDKYDLNSIAKLAGQIAAAGILVKSGALLSTIPLPDGNLLDPTHNESVILTIVLIVATINAVNFIDGLDGLAAGIVCIAAFSFFFYYYSLTTVRSLSLAIPLEAVPALAAVILAGACLGFLPHNFYPARIFMGDTGSMLLGLLLAYVPISAIPTLDLTSLGTKANRFAEILPFLLPAAVMVVPYTDLLRAVVRRTRAGLSPLAADRKHLHHRMLDIGHSHRESVLILYAWAALFSGVVVGLSILATPLLILAGFTLVAVLVLVLLSIPRLRWWQRDKTAGAAREPTARPPATGFQVAGKGQAARSADLRPVALAAPVPLKPVPLEPVPLEPVPSTPVPPASYVSKHGAPEPPTTPDIYHFREPAPMPAAPEPRPMPAAPEQHQLPDETRPDLLGTRRPRPADPRRGDTNLPPEPERDRAPEQRFSELGSGNHDGAGRHGAGRHGAVGRPTEPWSPRDGAESPSANGQSSDQADSTFPITVTRASGSIIP